MRLNLSLSCLLFALAACGGGEGGTEDVNEPTAAEPTGGGEAEPSPDVEVGQPYAPRPGLNVYVQGPDPAPGERFQARVPTNYHAEIVVTNTGDAPLELSFCMIDFQLVHDGEHIACGHESQTDVAPGPETLIPGEAHTYEARFHCAIDNPGSYELRAYMNFGAEIAPGEDRERYFIGSRDIVVE